MPTYRLSADLQPTRQALPRFIARLHGLGASVLTLHLNGQRLDASLQAAASAHRLEAALSRNADVRRVSVDVDVPAVTTYVVLRQERPDLRNLVVKADNTPRVPLPC